MMKILSRVSSIILCATEKSVIVTDDVIESPQSIVIPEAANREISATVVLKRLIEGL